MLIAEHGPSPLPAAAGGNLLSCLSRLPPLEATGAAHLVRALATDLQTLHVNGLVHCNVRLDNVLVHLPQVRGWGGGSRGASALPPLTCRCSSC